MNITNLLCELDIQGVKLWQENGQLKIRGPQSVLTSAITEQLRIHKEQIINLLLQYDNRGLTAEIKPLIPAIQDRYKPFPLTEIQQAYWVAFTGGFELGDITPHIYVELSRNDLVKQRLTRAWQQLIARHDVLRTVVLPSSEQQVLAETPDYEIQYSDFRQLNEQDKNAALETIRYTFSHQCFDPTHWPRFALHVVQITDSNFRIGVSLDLSAIDFVGILKLINELSQLYENPVVELPQLEITFRDYVLAEEKLRHTQLYKHSQQYWFDRIDSLPPPLQLPQAKQSSELKNYHFKNYTAILSAELCQVLHKRAKQFNITLSTLLLSAFAEILTLWSDSPRFTLNLTQYRRLSLHPQVNQIIGDSTSIILLAVDHTQQESFITRAQRLQQQIRQDLNYPYINGVTVLRELARRQQRFQQGSALMPVVFTSAIGLDASNLDSSSQNNFGERIYGISQTPQVWFDHQVFELGGNLYLCWDVIEELFPEGLISDMFAVYQEFLTALGNSEAIWHTLYRGLVPADQLAQRQIINSTQKPVSEGMLHTLFLQHVKQQPEASAIITTQRTLSYQELYQEANQIGHVLRQLGAKPNKLVAIVMEKGWEQVLAAYGILFSGAAYLPIDPELPQQRICQLLTNSEAKIVLTQPHLSEDIRWPEGILIRCIGNNDFIDADNSPLMDMQVPDDLAYVLYTSGSTGIPKGVMLDHRGPVNTILDVNQRFKMTKNDRVLALSAMSFDLSVFDIFGIHAAGGAIVIPDPSHRKDPGHWVDLMQQHKITFWNTVPALWQMLIEYLLPQPEKIPAYLKKVFLSGDWISLGIPAQIRSIWPQIEIVASGGGATEASIWNIFYLMDKVDPTWKRIPYGKPMNNSTFYVLNELLENRPVWAAGELYMGGIALAKGYWHDPEKTREKFIIHPITQERLYKTGDLGRYLPDGNIEILGRLDFQVKVNGYRIELSEIEAVLITHPQIDKAVVIYQNDGSNKQLIAYWIAKLAQAEPTEEDIKKYLLASLPEYMIPTVYIRLNELPLTTNGKLDKEALPKPQITAGKLSQKTAPQTEVETRIADIVCRTLNLSSNNNINIEDNLFDLGANSLNIVQLHAKLKTEFTQDIPIVEIFRHPTIRALAVYFTQADNSQPDIETIKVKMQKQKEFLAKQKTLRTKRVLKEET